MNFKTIKRWIPLVVIVALIAAAWLSGLMDNINLESVKAQREHLAALVAEHPLLSVLVFFIAYVVSTALSLPVASLLTLLGGFLFGRWLGTGVVVLAATMGSTIVFLIARSALGSSLRERAGPVYQKIASGMQKDAVNYMLFMRLIPLFPFFLVNIVPALFNVSLTAFFLTTLFGIIPGTFAYVNVGRELGNIHSLHDVASPGMLLALTLLGFFALLPLAYKKIKEARNK